MRGGGFRPSPPHASHLPNGEDLYNFEIQGACGGECENSDVCCGCRGRARQYLGDMWASDPKCWLNPEAKETYLR